MASLAKNTALLTGASILQKAVAFLYFAVIARTIGIQDTGSYFLALTLVTTVGVLTDLGVNSVLIRDSARSPEHTKDLLRKVLGIKIIAAPIAIVVALFFPVVLGYSAETIFLVRLAVAVMLADSISLTMYGVLRGAQVLRFEAIGIFVGQTITTIVGVVALFGVEVSLPILIVALFAGSAWNAIFSTYQVKKRFGLRALSPSFRGAQPILRAAFPFFLAAVFVKIYSSVDSYTLSIVVGTAAVGLYSVAYKLTYAFQFLPLAFVGALYPKMSSLVQKPEELKKVFLDAEWYLALLASPIVFGIFALAPEIVHFAYGTQYDGSVLPLSVLIFVLIPIFLDFPIGSLLNATGRQSVKTGIMGVTMVVNFVANLLCIQWFGIVGASIAGCVSFIVMFGLGAFMIRQQISMTVVDWIRSVGGFIFSGFVMAIFILLTKSFLPVETSGVMRFAWIAFIPFGAIIFGAIAILTKSLTKEHYLHVRAVLRKTSYGTLPLTNE